MQVAQGQVLVRVCGLVQAATGCCMLLLLVSTIVIDCSHVVYIDTFISRSEVPCNVIAIQTAC